MESNGRIPMTHRRYFIGGSDARIIMGDDEAALLRLWREKCGEVEPEDLSGNLVVQLGVATEELNRRWYEANSGQVLTDVQRQIRHPVLRWMAATLDGRVEATGAVFEAKFMLPWSFSEEGAAAPRCHSRAEVLALRRERRASTPVRRRATKTAHRSCPGSGYERLKFLGGICRSIPQHPASLPGPRALEVRTKGADAGGCQRSNRAWRSGQTVKIRSGQL